MKRAPLILVGPQRTGSTLIGRIISDAAGAAFTVNGRILLYLLQFLPRDGFEDWATHFRSDEIVHLLKRKPVLAAHPGFVHTFEHFAARIALDLVEEGERDRDRFIGELAFRIYAAWRPDAVFWGDKYNEYALELNQLAATHPDAMFVFTKRDHDASGASAMEAFADRPWQPAQIEAATRKVAAWQKRIDLFQAANPAVACCTVDYDQFIAEPVGTLSQLEEATGVTGLCAQASRVGNNRRHDRQMLAS